MSLAQLWRRSRTAARRMTLRTRMILGFSAFSLAVGLAAATLYPRWIRSHVLQSATERGRAVSDIVAYSISAPLFFRDSTGVSEVLHAVLRDPDVRFLVVRDAQGQLVARHGSERSERQGLTEDGATLVSSAQVRHQSDDIGSLVMGLNFEASSAAVRQAGLVGMLVGLIIFLVGTAATWTISGLLTRSLARVVETVRSIAGGDYSIRATEPRESELRELVAAFNGMVDNFVRVQHQLAGMNLDLESRVLLRTAELSDALDAQERAKAQLEQSEAQARATADVLRTLIDVAPQAILTMSPDHVVTRWNRAAEQLLGWSADDVIGRAVPHIPQEGRADWEASVAILRGGGTIGPTEVQRLRKDGTLVSVLRSTAPLKDREGRLSGYISVLTDLTERKKLEDQLLQSQKMEAIGQLAGGVAHDFNNILTIITACASILKDGGNVSEQQKSDLQEILDAAARAAALTRQLLTFSRTQVETARPVEIGAILTGMGPMLRRLLRENIDFRLAVEPSRDLVRADPTQLEQVVLNLVVNAADAMPKGGTLLVRSGRFTINADTHRAGQPMPGNYRTIVVQDTGCGMDRNTLTRIFEPFFTTKGLGHGTGLGLATTYAIIDRLGGQIDVQSAPGMGTTFTIYIPLSASAAREPGSTEAPRASGQVAGHESVLLVEDEVVVRNMLARSLTRLGYSVIEADNGRAALDRIAALGGGVDIVVTDVMMPGMTGQELAERLRVTHPQLQVVYMSGYADDQIRGRGLADETHAFMQKPFTATQLAATMRAALDKAVTA